VSETLVQFELVSPEQLLISEEVEMVVVPGSEGDFGVLPGHSPIITTVRPGVIHIFTNGTISSRIFVAGGFSEVTSDRCTVLAEEALSVDKIDKTKTESDLQMAIDEVNKIDNKIARKLAENRVTIERAKLSAINAPVYQ
jgi:F-type H+-transporting ATPase subunit epsilon